MKSVQIPKSRVLLPAFSQENATNLAVTRDFIPEGGSFKCGFALKNPAPNGTCLMENLG